MTPLATAYDNIRLMRRKVNIAQEDVARHPVGPGRDAAVMRVADLTGDLIRAIQDFADMGYEAEVADILARGTNEDRRAVYGLH